MAVREVTAGLEPGARQHLIYCELRVKRRDVVSVVGEGLLDLLPHPGVVSYLTPWAGLSSGSTRPVLARVQGQVIEQGRVKAGRLSTLTQEVALGGAGKPRRLG